MKLNKELRNKIKIRILCPIILAILCYITTIYNTDHRFYSYLFYFLFFCYLGFFIGFIIMSIFDRIGKKQELSRFLNETHSLVLLLLFYIAFNKIEVYFGATFQIIFFGTVLWVESEIN